ncbi:sugar phosphate isomerase/epimerase [Streptomyces sp. DSM 42041]|uniref:Sugar phosphate isomerase/epimerase n=1 Tax=Streptomyces hazeniae TaxID=3075538 RepID=A0ABU2NSW5_9ACTN|nr:sugar phosphate isomerase/epimerase [Streptomyces sp. DSM 42041]MDT0380086.1 sugar phosphate isomerase/epimerase [Streptomyces sp. DSM 42041]
MPHQPDPGPLDRRLRRRGLLGVAAGTAATALLGTATTPAAATGARGRGRPVLPPGRLGIQLYTVRDQVQEIGFARLFEHLARHGYSEVEFAGYTQGTGDLSLPALRRLLRDNGLRGVGSHVAYHADGGDPDAYSFATSLERVLDDAEALGLPAVGTPWAPNRHGDTVDAWKRAADDFHTYGAAARARGLTFYQHNHAEEFGFAEDRPDVRLYDLLLAETEPDLVHFEMDVYWAYVGQHRFSVRPDGTPAPFEPLDYVRAAPDRFPLFHVKDGEREDGTRDGYRMTDVGDGDLDYRHFIDTVASLPRQRRRHHWLVERDDAPDPVANPAGSLSTARRSGRHLRSLRSRGDCG